MERKKILIIDDSNFKNLELIHINLLRKNHDLSIVSSIQTFLNVIELEDNGLESFDIIFMDPRFSHYPLYDYELTNHGEQSGVFLYKDYMKNLKKTKIIIISYILDAYLDSKIWNKNVEFYDKRCLSSDDCLLNLVEKYCS